MADELKSLVERAVVVLAQLGDRGGNEFIKDRLLSHAYSVHARGRLLLRGIDRETYRTYCQLFSNAFPEKYIWNHWNAYVLDQFHRCVGILEMVAEVGT